MEYIRITKKTDDQKNNSVLYSCKIKIRKNNIDRNVIFETNDYEFMKKNEKELIKEIKSYIGGKL